MKPRPVTLDPARRSAPAAGTSWRRGLVAVIAATLVLLPSAGAAAGVTAASGAGRAPVARACSSAYFDGDQRLGPAQLQTVGQVAPMLAGYDRLAGLSPAQFIATYWDPAANSGAGAWRFPPDDGYLLSATGKPIEHVALLQPGERLDRFGSEFGAFLAPEDTPYAERALPPMSLDVFDANYTCNYHLYRVTKAFSAEEGPIAPAFGQVGHGLQIQLVGSLVPGAPSRLNVNWLLSNGYLAHGN
jgi:hypothetical protein